MAVKKSREIVFVEQNLHGITSLLEITALLYPRFYTFSLQNTIRFLPVVLRGCFCLTFALPLSSALLRRLAGELPDHGAISAPGIAFDYFPFPVSQPEKTPLSNGQSL